jgi:hypothetical protein
MKNMKRKVTLCLGLAVVVAVSIPASAQPAPRAEKYSLSGPYAYKNLAVFLIHAKDVKDKTKFMTLQEALEQKKVTVNETGTVNKLVIENVSDDVHIYIQSGDIVRGGKQDRTIGCDYVVPPKSGKIPLSSFCVESGRWRQRGNEKADAFAVSNNALPTRGLKVAANYSRSQSGVWQEVADIQDKLSETIGESVRSQESASSLELTLENKEVKEAVQKYIDAFSRLIQDRKDVVGFVSAINGELNSADVYASADLFKKVWPKMLKSCSVEALAELEKTSTFSHPTGQLAAAFLQDDDQAKIHERQIDDQLRVITRQSKDRIVFETYEAGRQKALHKSYIRVDPERLQQEAQQTQNPQRRRSITNSIQQQEPPQ